MDELGITCEHYRVRVTRKGQVTIPLEVRRALGIGPGSEVAFVLDGDGARLMLDRDYARREIDRMVGTAQSGLTTDEILGLTRE